MSVIVKRLKSTSMEIYVKGAPEVMQDICDPDSCTCVNGSTLGWALIERKIVGPQSRETTTICFRIILEMDSE
jgi:magnesium-transporting ATPase (P-type)